MIKDPFIKKIDRGEGKELILFSKNELNYKFFKGCLLYTSDAADES